LAAVNGATIGLNDRSNFPEPLEQRRLQQEDAPIEKRSTCKGDLMADRLLRRLAAPACALSLLFGVPARAQPPNCADDASVKGIRSQYNGLEAINQRTTKIKEIKDVTETYYGTAPPSFNQYANSNDRVLNVRWCQATLVLNEGSADTVYWFLADEQQGNRHSVVQDHCSSKHNLLDTTCAKWREHR
jgi:hypothetical protein